MSIDTTPSILSVCFWIFKFLKFKSIPNYFLLLCNVSSSAFTFVDVTSSTFTAFPTFFHICSDEGATYSDMEKL